MVSHNLHCTSWCDTNSNLPRLELPLSRTNFHGPKGVRAIEVRLNSAFLFIYAGSPKALKAKADLVDKDKTHLNNRFNKRRETLATITETMRRKAEEEPKDNGMCIHWELCANPVKEYLVHNVRKRTFRHFLPGKIQISMRQSD